MGLSNPCPFDPGTQYAACQPMPTRHYGASTAAGCILSLLVQPLVQSNDIRRSSVLCTHGRRVTRYGERHTYTSLPLITPGARIITPSHGPPTDSPLHSGMRVGTHCENQQGRSPSSTQGLLVVMEMDDWCQREERGRDAVERGPILEREPCGRILRK